MSPQNKFNKCYKPEREGSSLRGISRITGLAHNTVVNIVRSASVKAQLVQNHQVAQVQTEEVSADAPVVICEKNRSSVFPVN